MTQTMTNEPNLKEIVNNLKNSFIHAYKSDNAQVKQYASNLANCDTTQEFKQVQHTINLAHNNGTLSIEDTALLTDLADNLWHGFIWKEPKYSNADLVKTFTARIWKIRNFNSTIQLRNAISDMYLLKFLTLNEYIALNNELDDFLSFVVENNLDGFFNSKR